MERRFYAFSANFQKKMIKKSIEVDPFEVKRLIMKSVILMSVKGVARALHEEKNSGVHGESPDF